MEPRIFSPLDLAAYNGEDAPEIYISFLGTVYDVTSRPDLYGRSPPGPYHLFAGRECARALATMSMDPDDVGRTDVGDLAALTQKLASAMGPEEVRNAVGRAMRDWQERLAQSYSMVGTMRPWLKGKVDDRAPAPPRPSTGLRGSSAQLREEAELERPTPGPPELVCRKPQLLLQRHFLAPQDCRQLIAMTLRRQAGSRFEKKVRAPLEVEDPRWSPSERALLQSIEERIAELTGGPLHGEETALVGTLTPGGHGGGSSIADHLGLHVDTNAAPWRFCTAIIYLSSVPCGGETVFPAAITEGLPSEEEELAVDAAGRLLDLGFDHTDKALLPGEPPQAAAAARELLGSVTANSGRSVHPEEGSICVFWTRQDDGEIDRHSWHGGAPVPEGDCWKWTLQKFKEVPGSVRQDPAALADFVRHTRGRARTLV
uniref:Cytochrome b5 heme-binding domain-containing protein n=1 Tax=Alexandrium monilatum TaxID=311494 RepID=A0A7S4V2G0_9DINO